MGDRVFWVLKEQLQFLIKYNTLLKQFKLINIIHSKIINGQLKPG